MNDPGSLFRGKKVTVMGLGLLGRGLGDTLFLIRLGADVTVTDLKTAEQLAQPLKELEGLPVSLRLGEHHEDDFSSADLILRNADVPRSSRFLKIAADNGIPIEMDESLFCKNFKGRIVGVTGTRGKTTTTTLIYNILSASGSRVFLAGNIKGVATLPLLEQAGPDDIVVLELSSWQLQGFHDSRISPNAAVFTNIYPDHMNRYSGMEEYIHDKKAIFLYQGDGDFCIFNGDQPETAALAEEAPAENALFRIRDVPQEWRIKLPGRHNRANIAAAVRLTEKMGVPLQTIRSTVEDFSGVEHRLQWIGEKAGVEFVNDTTSTTPEAGCAALESFEGRRILLIAGGSSKQLDLQSFARAAASRAAWIALLDGDATGALEKGIVAEGEEHKLLGRFHNMKSAVHCLLKEARPGDLILLSPGCASFGMFQNEFHRGQTFIDVVNEITE